MTRTVFQGPWNRAPNFSADETGSIHDGDRARSLGFEDALIGGSTLAAFMTEPLDELFGRDWYERGFLRQSWVKPVYGSDEFRIFAEEEEPTEYDDRLLSFGLEKRDGARAMVGYAGLAHSPLEAPAPWQRPDQRASVFEGDDPLSDEPIGTVYPTRPVVVMPDDPQNAERRDAADIRSPWYVEASPWGPPIVPTHMFLLVGLGAGSPSTRSTQTAPGDQRAGMNGTFQMLLSGPLLCGERYELRPLLAEKGFSGRTWFRTIEFTIEDASGQRLVTARQKIRWFRSTDGTSAPAPA